MKISKVRPMTGEEMEAEGWDYRPSVMLIVLEDGTKIYPSTDEEGNGPGCLFTMSPNGLAGWLTEENL